MNILAVDYGTKNIGLAWAQMGLGVVLPYGVIKDKNLDELVKLIKKENIDKVIVGLPLGLKEKENANTEKIKKFASDLKNLINIPIEFEDERFSSQAADRMSGGGASRDEKSAMVILQSYLEKNK
jgi:putative Holliday junction resolvase